MLPSVVSTVAATLYPVQERFPRAYLSGALRLLSGDQVPPGIIGDRVPVWDFGEPAPSGAAYLSFCFKSLLCMGAMETRRLCGGCRGRGISTGETKFRAVLPHAVQHHPDPARQRNRCALFAARLGDIPCPGTQPIRPTTMQHHCRRLIKRRAQPNIAGPCYSSNDIAVSGLFAPWG